MISSGAQISGHLTGQELDKLENVGKRFESSKFSDREKIEKAARNFESYMLSYMYKEMHKSVPKSGFASNPQFEGIFMGMYMDEVAKSSDKLNNGIADMLVKQYEDKFNLAESLAKEAQDVAPKKDFLASVRDIASNVSHSIKEAFGSGASKTDEAFVARIDDMMAKLSDKLTSGFGPRHHPILDKESHHDGMDFALDAGTPVELPSEGKVVFAGEKGGYGNTVVVDHGQGVTTLYAHLNDVYVEQGQQLRHNDVVGSVGSTGRSTGAHLHFEVRKDGKALDPVYLRDELK